MVRYGYREDNQREMSYKKSIIIIIESFFEHFEHFEHFDDNYKLV
jgi:hypothetical protein